MASEPQPPSWQGVCIGKVRVNCTFIGASFARKARYHGQRLAYGSADLNKILSDGLAVVHGVESCDFVNAHGGHLQHAGDLVHDADAGEAVLALAEVQQGHDGSLLVLGRVALEDLIGDLEVLLGELERDARVVVRLVAVLLGTKKGC
jgi:hypothetical protein